MINTTHIRTTILTFILLFPLVALAQGPGFDDDVQDAPIDGGISVLAAAAVGYGIKKLKDGQKQKQTKTKQQQHD